jgi:hypothetical protein
MKKFLAVSVALVAVALGGCSQQAPSVSPTVTKTVPAPTVTVTPVPSPPVTVTVTPTPDTPMDSPTAKESEPPASKNPAPVYTTPEEMEKILVPAMDLTQCAPVARDISGARFIQCATASGAAVRMSIPDVTHDNAGFLSEQGWQVYSGPGWNVAVGYGSSAETNSELSKYMDQAVTALTK